MHFFSGIPKFLFFRNSERNREKIYFRKYKSKQARKGRIGKETKRLKLGDHPKSNQPSF